MNRRPFRSLTAPAIALAAVFALAPLVALPAWAYLVKTNARPVAPALGYAAAPYDSYMLVWAEDRGTGTGLDIYGIRLTASGIGQGYEVPIIVSPGNQSDPTLAYNERIREFMLIYTDDSGGAVEPPVPGGLPTPGGGSTPGLPTPVSGTPPVPPPPPFDVEAGAIDQPALLLEGDAIAQSAPLNLDSGANDQPPGTPPGFPTQPGPTATPGGPPPATGTTGSRDLYGTFISPGGQRMSQIFQVVASPADDTYPDLAYMPREGREDLLVLAWREVTGVDASVSSMTFTSYGHFYSPSIKRNVVTGGDLGRPSVAAEIPSQEFLVVWSQTPTDDPARDLFARRLQSNGVPYGAPIRIERSKAPVDDVYPSLGSMGPDGGFVVTWERRDGASAPDIQSRRLTRNGVPYRNQNTPAGGAAFSFAPDVSSSYRNSTLLAWLDRNAASDHSILIAEVTRDGRRIGPARLVVQGGTGPSALTPVAPPGFPTLPPLPTPVPTP